MGHWSGPKSLLISSLRYYHSPDTHLSITRGHEKDPICVKSGVITDGMKRTYQAIQNGQTHIKAYVWVD